MKMARNKARKKEEENLKEHLFIFCILKEKLSEKNE